MSQDLIGGAAPFRTRADLLRLADESLLALRPWATRGHARFDLPGPGAKSGPIADGVEAFARSFLAAGFRLSAADSDPHGHAEWYAEGIRAGVSRASTERWPTLVEAFTLRVEAAAIAIALHESRTWIWDRLSPLVQEELVEWLSGALGAWYPESNWLWFHNVVNAFLRSVGAPHDQARVDEALDFLDSCYLGDGWYTDGSAEGRGRNIDWYAGWVMQQYSLWYCRMSVGQPGIEQRQAVYAERLASYVAAVSELFGSDGAALYQGRSLVYRYATVGALWTSAVVDASPLPLGRLRRICMRTIDYHLRRGAFDERGLLRLGWHGEFVPMKQNYSGSGSPYWANLGLAGLVLPDDHPVWTAPDEPARIETEDRVVAMPAIGWLTSGTRSDGIVRVVNHGVDHSGPTPGSEQALYARFGYSTATAPIPRAVVADSLALDNQVAIIDRAGRWSQRSIIEAVAVEGRRAESRHIAWFASLDGSMEDGPRLRCVSVVRGPVEVRAVRLDSDFVDAQALVISGFAVPLRPAPGAREELVGPVVPLSAGGRAGRSVHAIDTPFGSEQLVEWCRFDEPRSGRWHIAGVGLSDHDVDWPAVATDDDGEVVIVWPDGLSDRFS